MGSEAKLPPLGNKEGNKVGSAPVGVHPGERQVARALNYGVGNLLR